MTADERSLMMSTGILDNAIQGGGDRGRSFPESDAMDLRNGAAFIPGEVTIARRAGQRVAYDSASRTWSFPDGSTLQDTGAAIIQTDQHGAVLGGVYVPRHGSRRYVLVTASYYAGCDESPTGWASYALLALSGADSGSGPTVNSQDLADRWRLADGQTLACTGKEAARRRRKILEYSQQRPHMCSSTKDNQAWDVLTAGPDGRIDRHPPHRATEEWTSADAVALMDAGRQTGPAVSIITFAPSAFGAVQPSGPSGALPAVDDDQTGATLAPQTQE